MARGFKLRHLLAGIAVFVADQWTKGLIDKTPAYYDHTVIPGLFRIIHAENPGVAFGLFQNASPLFRDLLIGASSVALLIVLLLLWRSKQSSRTGYAMALIVAGACGNLVDRMLHGKVVDFLLFYAGNHRWPVFNLADSAIVVGAALLVWEIIHDHPAPHSVVSAPVDAAAATVDNDADPAATT